ncbi:hypothetical protein [Nocardia sp. XZ_19_369]|uniref:hypothetical protein n=1 Tax=Nocardia sp. XZ_19_369 TaxID=2769487 RepID=UPI00188E78FD|nr:hypothetical protein [Nocardia sp. XZ_19_369]
MGIPGKIRHTVGTTAAGALFGIAGIAGFALAASVQSSAAGGGSSPAESHATVVGAHIGVLLPGEKAYITLTLSNPNANVQAKLLPIRANDVVIDTVADPADKPYCHDQIELSTVGADPHLPTLAKNETNHPYRMIDAVILKADTDARCQGMTFHTTWIAQFENVP